MILVVGGTKGGSGKTLLATSLSVLRTAAGQDVLLIDADEQGSAMDFTRQRQRRTEGDAGYTAIQTREADVTVQVRRMVQKYGDIVIDVQPVSYDFALISKSYYTNKYQGSYYESSHPSSSSISSRQ